MKCRRINPENGMIVWFGVKDVKKDTVLASNNVVTSNSTIVGKRKTIFQSETNKHDNYATGTEGVENSLRQRLSVLKHELWYDYNNGMPLTDKVRKKAIVDAYVIQTVLKHPDVIEIEGFESEQVGHQYSCYMIVNTIYGKIELGI